MTPKGDDLGIKAGVALVAVDFILSLPNWALGIILILALALKFAIDWVRQNPPDSEHPPSPPTERNEPR